jgi:glutathione S-transferase
MMTLFFSPLSPFVRKVRMTAAIKGLESQIKSVPTDATAGDAALNAANPLGRLPSLLLANGETIHDSPVICEYLDSIGTGPALFPPVGPERWRALTLAATADGITECALFIVYETRFRPQAMYVQAWVDRQQGKLDRAMAELEKSPPMMGAQPNYGHVTLAAALGYLDLRQEGRWRAGHPKLVAWLANFAKAVPSFDATKPVA